MGEIIFRPSLKMSRVVGFSTIGVSFAVLALAFGSDAGIATAVQWCNDRFLAAIGTQGTMMVTLAVVLVALALLYAFGRVTVFLAREVVARRNFELAIQRSRVPLPRNVRIASTEVCGDVVVVAVEDHLPFAVSVGLLSPKIVVSDSLSARCTISELRAVLAHEAAHCRARHPLQRFMWELFRQASVFAPIVADVAVHSSLKNEFDADATACSIVGRRPLISAMLKAVDVSPAYACSSFGQLHERASALATSSRAPLRLNGLRMGVTLASIVAISALSSTLQVRASSVPSLCSDDTPAMSMINFSPYLSFTVAPTDVQMSTAPPRSGGVPLMDIAR